MADCPDPRGRNNDREQSRAARILRAAAAVGVAVATAGTMLMAGPASAAPNPPGNNGTIKIDDIAFDDPPNNEPHVGCTFQVDFYGYDEGDLNAASPSRPTRRPAAAPVLLTDTVFIGEDDNSGGGCEAGLDASETYTLDFTGIEPAPVQGFHVKLTINADGSPGRRRQAQGVLGHRLRAPAAARLSSGTDGLRARP